jgi:hypothetical protein
MSRVDKKPRRKHRKEKKHVHSRVMRERLSPEDFDAVDEILDRKFDLKLLYPERDIFHVSEYRAFLRCDDSLLYAQGRIQTGAAHV